MSDERRICLICGRVVDYWEGLGYRHSVAATDPTDSDHPVIAVRVDEAAEQLRGRCDFCFSDDPTHTLPARSFTLGPSHSVGDWSACELCAREIERNAWNRLLARVQASWVARHGSMANHDADFRQLYRTLRKNITGPIYRTPTNKSKGA